MKIGIMQPYFMPYIGYWQLINEVDKFVLLDDVNYIMRGYINRNNILLNGEIYRFTIPVSFKLWRTIFRFSNDKPPSIFCWL